MKTVTVDLQQEYGLASACTLTGYLHEGNPEMPLQTLPALLIFPGGGYAFCSEREGEPVAVEFYNRNCNAFVLQYAVAPTARYPQQLQQAACAADYLTRHAADFSILPSALFVMGFSAGGHLAGSLANARVIPDFPQLSYKLAGVLLSYAVISDRPGQADSFRNLLGEQADTLLNGELGRLRLHTSVKADNPPAFVWTTSADTCVAPQNAMMYATACAEAGVPYELYVFPQGEHGLSVADERTAGGHPDQVVPAVQRWLSLAAEFIRRYTRR